jgi:hypothetical protein
LPFEGGRRPDVVVLAGDAIVILEFKTTPLIAAPHIDQVAAYARDIREYHEASHWRRVVGVLVSTNLETQHEPSGDVTVCGRAGLAQVLNDYAAKGSSISRAGFVRRTRRCRRSSARRAESSRTSIFLTFGELSLPACPRRLRSLTAYQRTRSASVFDGSSF